jgi:hypothetical protein
MMADPATIKEALQTRRMDRRPRPRRSSYPRIDRGRALEFIWTVLDGLEPPIGIRQVARRLNISVATLSEQFPQESTLVVAQYRAYLMARKEQRITQTCDAVRQAVLILHEQRIDPSYERVKAILPDPNIMARLEARTTWHVVRNELGLED